MLRAERGATVIDEADGGSAMTGASMDGNHPDQLDEARHQTGQSPRLTAGTLRKQITKGDPKLQRLAAQGDLVKAQTGKRSVQPISGADVGQVELIGQLKDPRSPVPGLRIIRQLGDLFTATAAAVDVTQIAQHENIVTIQMAQPLSPTLIRSVAEINATPKQLCSELPTGAPVPDGRGVIVGIVDYGCDFAHHNFRHTDGTTRLLALWHQDAPLVEGQIPAGFFHGQEFSADAINLALQADEPYAALGYNPGLASHGTHVMDIAAGNGRASSNPGVAPAADLIFVHIGGDGQQGSTFGNSKNLMEAADYIFQKADQFGRPAVVNFSLGTHGGPHDGSTPAERWLDQLLQEPNRAIVVSAGNSYQHRAHTMGVVSPEKPARLPWIIQPHDPTDNEIEIWYNGTGCLEVALYGPDGSLLTSVPRGHSQSIFNAAAEEIISIIHNEFDSRNGDHQISILLDRSLAPTEDKPALWHIELRANGDGEVTFHAWVERDDAAQTNLSFFHPSIVSSSHTLGSISCGRDTITVGSYQAGDPDKAISPFSSAGPTRDGREKPEISAPGQHFTTADEDGGVLAAESGTNGSTRKAGTSMAAPHVTGLIALLLQNAKVPLSINQIRSQLFKAIRNEPPNATAWHPQYGFGRADAKMLFQDKQNNKVG